MLYAYVPMDAYVKGAYIDAQDETKAYIMGKIIEANATEIIVNFDGWSEKFDQ